MNKLIQQVYSSPRCGDKYQSAIATILEGRIDPWLARRFSSMINPSWTLGMPLLDVRERDDSLFVVATYSTFSNDEQYDGVSHVKYDHFISTGLRNDEYSRKTHKVDADYLEEQMKGCLGGYTHREEHSLYDVYKQFYRGRYIVNKGGESIDKGGNQK